MKAIRCRTHSQAGSRRALAKKVCVKWMIIMSRIKIDNFPIILKGTVDNKISSGT